MSLVVCLITHQRPVMFAHTLQSLLSQTVLPEGIVIVDNSQCLRSLDSDMAASLLSWAALIGVRIVTEHAPPLGMVDARIAAEKLAAGAFPGSSLMVCDDDHVLGPRFIEDAVAALKKYDVVGGYMFSARTTEPSMGMSDFEECVRGWGTYSGGCFCYRPKWMGFWELVRDKTEAFGEDGIWQGLVSEGGASFAPYSKSCGVHLHLDVYSGSKYGGEVGAKLVTELLGGKGRAPVGTE